MTKASNGGGRSDRGGIEELSRLFIELGQAMHARTMGDTLLILSDAKLTFPQLIALHVLKARGAHTVSDLALKTRLSIAAASHLVERLVRLGLVSRAESEADRRRKEVALSASGLRLVERLNRTRMEGLSRSMALIDPRTRDDLVRVLSKVVSTLRESKNGLDIEKR